MCQNLDAEACFELGMSYSCGADGVEVDLVAAHMWFNLAAIHGDARGQEMRAEIAHDMDASQIAAAQRSARAHMLQAA